MVALKRNRQEPTRFYLSRAEKLCWLRRVHLRVVLHPLHTLWTSKKENYQIQLSPKTQMRPKFLYQRSNQLPHRVLKNAKLTPEKTQCKRLLVSERRSHSVPPNYFQILSS